MIFTFSPELGTVEAPDRNVALVNPDSPCPSGSMQCGFECQRMQLKHGDRARGCNCSLADNLLFHSPARTPLSVY
ncbi:MAG: hypothetical protein JGK24_20260 [Microcoleus sp. PH2017_29_MFU_D_A]|uniref:hypothetical protein n=1 Tax=unclassified Microcoleus TaxID=2642155 RepID=UPI001DD97E6C|nr:MULTISPECIES: hypothetical protein [unclassified Microcoleus]MCC3413382.1 hypothetical protein [Microcoleus sp. PH2017_02_FOX_O_A]MCC3418282.1 hypothetical protein [Microcoleus sp. PH2017_07_MST_O_A]MCC3429882.1 hypothetical protein [Microcoleus sp. PH2017_04_SCI_O_A]MCC3510952.1 hypothetical protein [Microcoleus sp. PH2017_17_BER_D_A]TAG19664.1 MAG: hypothetical protein EAZ39_08790 [Oscillatoriales cyanobacterium]